MRIADFFRVTVRLVCVVGAMGCLLGLAVLVSRYGGAGTGKSLTICAWGDMFHPAMIERFEKETGIKVHLSSFTSNEELIVKMRATQGAGYDLIVPSDYAVGILRDEQLLKPLDKQKVPLKTIYSPLKNHFFDPENVYTIPFEWEVFGYGINTDLIADDYALPLSWKTVFKKPIFDKIIMINDPLEAVWMGAAALDLIDRPVVEWRHPVSALLKDQKKFVAAYTDNRADYYLVTNNGSLAVASSSYLWRCQREDERIAVFFPTDPVFFTVEHFALPVRTAKDDLAYAFITFMMQTDVQWYHAQKFFFLPADVDALQLFFEQYPEKQQLMNELLVQRKLFFSALPSELVAFVWMHLKS